MDVYLITNKLNNKKYIGCTTKGYLQRFEAHLEKSRQKGKKEAIHKAMAKYGTHNFEVSLIESCQTNEEMFALEKKWIEHYKSFGSEGYNLTVGGEGTMGHTMSQSQKNRLRSLRTGTKHTEESKRKMSLARRGKSFSDSHKKALSKAQLGSKNHRWGKVMSDEQKQKLREDNTGQRNRFYGRTHSEETKRLLSEKNKGRHTGSSNPASRTCVIDGKRFETGKQLREHEKINISKFYKLLKEGKIVYED